MAVDAKIVVDGIELDVASKDVLKLALDFAVSDISDLSKIKKDTSKTITIPASKKNDQALGFGTDPNSAAPVDQKVRKASHFEIGGTTLIEGFIKVNDRITDDSGVVKLYKVVIIGSNGEWKEQLAELDMTDLNLTDQDHVWNKANIDASETVAASRIYVYPLINYGKFSGGSTVKVDDRFPAVNKLALMNRMFNAIGWILDSSFLNDTFFSKLYLPFTNEIFGHPQSFVDARIFRVAPFADYRFSTAVEVSATRLSIGDETTIGLFDNGNLYDSGLIIDEPVKDILFQFTNVNKYSFDGTPDLSKVRVGSFVRITGATNSVNNGHRRVVGVDNINKSLNIDVFPRFNDTNDEIGSPAVADILNGDLTYTVDTEATINFTINLIAEVALDNVKFVLKLIRRRSGVNTTLDTKSIKNINVGSPGLITLIVDSGFVQFLPGDEVFGVVSSVIVSQTAGSGSSSIVIKKETTFSNDISREIVPGQTVILSDQLPEMTQLTYIQGIRDTYNLFFSANVNTRTVTVLPRDQFYNDSSKAVDWTKKIDDSKPKTTEDLSESVGKNITYTWAQDSNDAIVEIITKVKKEIFASVEFDNPNKFVRGETQFGPTIFAATYMDLAREIGLTSSLIPKMWSDNPPLGDVPEKNTGFLPRILYYDGVQSLAIGETWDFEDDTRTDFPRMLFDDATQDNANSLHFVDTQRSNGLQERFWRGAQQMIDEGIVHTLSLNLNDADINTLNFRNPVFLKDGFYLIDRIINYKPLVKGSTQVRFLKFIDIKQIAKIVANTKVLPAPGGESLFTNQDKPSLTVDVNGNISINSGSASSAFKKRS